MIRIIPLLLIAVQTLSFAGTADVKPYEWEKDRKRTALSAEERAGSEIVLKQHTQYQYALEDNQFLMYTTTHFIIWVNTNEAIEKNNKIHISMNSTFELAALKARVINKDGKSIYFDLSNLKEVKNEETGNAYRIFAMEGVELDSEIEYFYTRKMAGDSYERVITQFDAPVKQCSFMLSTPKHLKFDFKSYYDAPQIKQNTANQEINEYLGVTENIPALKSEPFSYYNANRSRIEFKLAFNTARSQSRLNTWDEAAKTFYSILTEKSKADEKSLEKFIKSLNDNPLSETDIRIKNIEKQIKTSIQIEPEKYGEQLSIIESVIKNKIASSKGSTKLFFAIFQKLGIDCHPVITCSRERRRFDGTFDTWGYLDEFLLYFPATQKFLAPGSFESRYPFIPADLTSQEGLFIEPFAVGELKSALSSIGKIPATDYRLTSDDLKISVTFNEDLATNTIFQSRDFAGYNALEFIPYYDAMTKEQQSDMIEKLIQQTAPDAKIKTWQCNSKTEPETYKFNVEVEFESTHFIEKAGNRILLKAGELIGRQSELYRDDKRVLGVENTCNRGYVREVKITIPKGYAIKNPQELKMDVSFKDGNQEPFLFRSDYKLEGDQLTISIDEFYKQIYAPVEKYEDFRKVINAAADFNKITLVLEKLK
jgi:hypothetical protein